MYYITTEKSYLAHVTQQRSGERKRTWAARLVNSYLFIIMELNSLNEGAVDSHSSVLPYSTKSLLDFLEPNSEVGFCRKKQRWLDECLPEFREKSFWKSQELSLESGRQLHPHHQHFTLDS